MSGGGPPSSSSLFFGLEKKVHLPAMRLQDSGVERADPYRGGD